VPARLFVDPWERQVTDLEDALQRARAVADCVTRAIEGKSVDKVRRKLLAGSAFQLATEHHHSMILLVENQKIGSALALQRPLFEAFSLGHWLSYWASDSEVDDFAEGRRKPSLEFLRRALVDGNPGGPSHADMQRLVSRMHDLTHGGIGHLVLRLSASRLGPCYFAEQIVVALDVASWTAGMAALDLAGSVIGDVALASILTDEVRAILRNVMQQD
jgi:hypothetical protein